jgi:hypothetical protein
MDDNVNDITRMVKEHWVAVTGAYPCLCGHNHHGRQLVREGVSMHLAPQYGFCDNDLCPCTTLQRAGLL